MVVGERQNIIESLFQCVFELALVLQSTKKKKQL